MFLVFLIIFIGAQLFYNVKISFFQRTLFQNIKVLALSKLSEYIYGFFKCLNPTFKAILFIKQERVVIPPMADGWNLSYS